MYMEESLNKRTLTPLQYSKDGIEAITLGHFLVGAPLEAWLDTESPECWMSLLLHWCLCQTLVRCLWQSWSTEYLGKAVAKIFCVSQHFWQNFRASRSEKYFFLGIIWIPRDTAKVGQRLRWASTTSAFSTVYIATIHCCSSTEETRPVQFNVTSHITQPYTDEEWHHYTDCVCW